MLEDKRWSCCETICGDKADSTWWRMTSVRSFRWDLRLWLWVSFTESCFPHWSFLFCSAPASLYSASPEDWAAARSSDAESVCVRRSWCSGSVNGEVESFLPSHPNRAAVSHALLSSGTGLWVGLCSGTVCVCLCVCPTQRLHDQSCHTNANAHYARLSFKVTESDRLPGN